MGSHEATFDRELHEACLRKSLNFARYPEIRSIRIDFLPEEFAGISSFSCQSGESFYGDDLTPLSCTPDNRYPGINDVATHDLKKAGDIMKKSVVNEDISRKSFFTLCKGHVGYEKEDGVFHRTLADAGTSFRFAE